MTTYFIGGILREVESETKKVSRLGLHGRWFNEQSIKNNSSSTSYLWILGGATSNMGEVHMNLIELEKKIKEHEVIQKFKDGVTDAMLHGTRDEKQSHHYYKQGYDYGITLYGQFLDLVSEGLAKKNRRMAND